MFSDESLKIQLSISPYVNADIYMCVYIHIHIYTHTHICALSHVYMSIYLMQFLPAIWTQELANNVSVREKLRFLKSPGAWSHKVSWNHEKEQPLQSGSQAGRAHPSPWHWPNVHSQSTHAAWPSRLTPSVITASCSSHKKCPKFVNKLYDHTKYNSSVLHLPQHSSFRGLEWLWTSELGQA